MSHALRYRTYSVLFDLDEIDELVANTRLLSHNRWNLFSLHDRDFGPRDGSPLGPWIDDILRSADIHLEGGSIQIIGFPRLLGYTFNPLTIWLCHHSDGSLRAVLYEIHNTFGHSHSHLVPIDPTNPGPYRHGFDKELHVSPFFDQAGRYTFLLRPPADRFSVSIDYEVAGEPMLTATMSATRRPLTSSSLLRAFFTHPLLTVKITFGIHWHALRLWLKGTRYRPIPAPPPTAVSVVGYFDHHEA